MTRQMPATRRKAAARPNGRIRGGKDFATPELPQGSLDQIRRQARDCRRCGLWKTATQTVFGEGPPRANVMLIGEQPGQQEDMAGRPFVGPAGRLLDRALHAAGLSRESMYVTNTVKHFKFEPRGKARLHKRADASEQHACRPWLDAEIARVQPRLIVCLGSMAARAAARQQLPAAQATRNLASARGREPRDGDGPSLVPAAPAGCACPSAGIRRLGRRLAPGGRRRLDQTPPG